MDGDGLFKLDHPRADVDECLMCDEYVEDCVVEDNIVYESLVITKQVVIDNAVCYISAYNEDDKHLNIAYFDFSEIIDESFNPPLPEKNTRRSTLVKAPTYISVRGQNVYWKVRVSEFQDTKTRRNYKQFLNCMIFTFQIPDRNICTIKIFKNGTMHITGCKSEEEVLSVCNDFIQEIATFLVDNGFEVKTPTLGKIEFCMTKAGFEFDTKGFVMDGSKLDMHILVDRMILSGKFYDVDYNPDKYFGIKTISINPAYKTNIFKSGSVNLYTTSPAQVFAAFDNLKEVLATLRWPA